MNYIIHMEPKFADLELMDVPSLIEDCTEKWFNQTLCKVNDSVIRLGVFNEGEFHWHKHDHEDEYFFVLSGKLYIELEGHTFEILPHQGITITKGVMHRPYVVEPTAVLMVESDGVTPVGD